MPAGTALPADGSDGCLGHMARTWVTAEHVGSMARPSDRRATTDENLMVYDEAVFCDNCDSETQKTSVRTSQA